LTLGTGRGDLQPVVHQQLAKVTRDPLAQREVDPARMVDHEPQALGGHTLAGDDLELGLDAREAALDVLSDLLCVGVHHSVQVEKKVG
jgi:hypothetical protein